MDLRLLVHVPQTLVIIRFARLQAINDARHPDRAPEAPKHARVARVGVLPGRLTVNKGSSVPVTLPILEENQYLAFW